MTLGHYTTKHCKTACELSSISSGCNHGRWKCLKVGGASSGCGHGEREPITGVWGRSPQRGPGTEPLVGGQGGEAPKLKAFLVLERPTERQNSKMFKSIRLSLTSQCRRLKLLGEQELWPALPCQKLGKQLLPLLPLFQRPCPILPWLTAFSGFLPMAVTGIAQFFSLAI